jgi:broad specificity phosphatase PhoE
LITRMYLIRHVEAEGNTKLFFQGQTDTDVSGDGIKQLEKLAEQCRYYHFDALYSSPLLRTRRTAQAANRYHGLPMIIDDGIIELDAGQWERVDWGELRRKYPELCQIWDDRPWDFCAPGGEPIRSMYDRIWKAMVRIAAKHKGQQICVVSHGCASRSFLCHALGKPIEGLNNVPRLSNAAINIIDFDFPETGGEPFTQVVGLNDTSYLGELAADAAKGWGK